MDRAALDAARILHVPIAGVVPAGWCTEDGHADHWRHLYPELEESADSGYAARTRRNIVMSDALLLICPTPLAAHPGSRLTWRLARDAHIPALHVSGNTSRTIADIARIHAWLADVVNIAGNPRLMIAGPRESGAPGIYQRARTLCESALM